MSGRSPFREAGKYFFFVLVLMALINKSEQMSFRLFKNRQFCISIPNSNSYQFEYSSSSQNEQNIKCQIYNGNNIIEQVSYKSQHSTTFNITEQSGKVCFISLDTITKVVSFDLMPLNDPMRSQIIQKDYNQLFESMELLYRSIQRLYRNQHFYYEKNRVHREFLSEIQTKLKVIRAWKIILLLLCGILQYFFIKKIIDRKSNQSPIMSKSRQSYIKLPANA